MLIRGQSSSLGPMKRPRFLKTNFKTSERQRFHRRVLPLLLLLVFALAGPLGIWLKSTRVQDYKPAVQRAKFLSSSFANLFQSAADSSARLKALQNFFTQEESLEAGLIAGTEKQIHLSERLLSSPAAPFAMVAFHGFMATRQELSPVLEDAADQLNVPLFLARIPHHGVEGDDFRDLTLTDYVTTIAEAEVVGAHLAPELAVVGVSTGAPMAMMMAAQTPETVAAVDVDAKTAVVEPVTNPVRSLILISPNFGLPRWGWRWASGPLGDWLTRLFVGKRYEWKPKNEEHARYWTESVSSEALRPMVEMVQLGMKAGETRLDWSKVSLLLVQNPTDSAVDNEQARRYLEQFNFKRFEYLQMDANDHVLAGRILNPQNNAALTTKIVEFLSVP